MKSALRYSLLIPPICIPPDLKPSDFTSFYLAFKDKNQVLIWKKMISKKLHINVDYRKPLNDSCKWNSRTHIIRNSKKGERIAKYYSRKKGWLLRGRGGTSVAGRRVRSVSVLMEVDACKKCSRKKWGPLRRDYVSNYFIIEFSWVFSE